MLNDMTQNITQVSDSRGVSFIHSGDLYSASSRNYYSEALPSKSQTKKKDFREM